MSCECFNVLILCKLMVRLFILLIYEINGSRRPRLDVMTCMNLMVAGIGGDRRSHDKCMWMTEY